MNQAPIGQAPAQQLPHDIRPLLPYRPTLMDYWPWLAAGVAVLAALLVAFYLWRKRRAAPKTVAAADPWDVLFSRLRSLAIGRQGDGAAMIEFFFHLSLLLREAIEQRTGIRATDLTLGELRGPLRKKLPLATDQVEAVLMFLERSDLVKFAGFAATPDEASAAKEQVTAWARSLKPPPAPPVSRLQSPTEAGS